MPVENLFAPMLFLHASNRYEILRSLLLAHLSGTPGHPLSLQEIIVPNVAIQSDLERAIADQQGVATGIRFSFLARWLWQRIAALLPNVAEESPFAPERSQWRIMRLLADETFIRQPTLRAYLAEADPLMRHELAAKIAALFSAYAIYRPDYLTNWQAGRAALKDRALPHEDWQAALWRKLAAELGLGAEHPALLFFATLADETQNAAKKLRLSHALRVFCLSELPPLHLEMLTRMADWVDIHLYLLNPCRAYWLDLLTSKARARLEVAGHADYLESGHPLLADWGGQTQALFIQLLQNDRIHASEYFAPDAGTSLLVRLQNSLLEGEPPAAGAWSLEEADRSVEIHVAHSLFRQLEILRDQLLARIKTDSTLRLSDIVVLLPDLESAAPWIEAVFARGKPHIPHAIAGYAAPRKNAVAHFLLALLNLAAPGSRLPASEVFAFLREPLVAAALGLSDDDAENLCAALKTAGARWGLDTHRKSHKNVPDESPLEARHTWRDALARLFLGYASAPIGEAGEAPVTEPFLGLLPAGNLSGSRARILGSAWLLLERLEKLRHALIEPLSAEGWRTLWQQVLDEWLGDGEDIADTPEMTGEAALRQTLAALHTLCDDMAAANQGNHAQQAEPLRIPAQVALAALETALQTDAFGARPSGALTFAALSGLRALPYRMVCLLGLDDGAFPRREQAFEFDLMPLEFRQGDRRQGSEARNLFLDLILSARETLYLSYSGKSQRDDGDLLPSLLLTQLRDFLCKATGAPLERLQIVHPLQAFSPEYFSGDSRRVSFMRDYAEALQNAQSAAEASGKPFFVAPLPTPVDTTVHLTELQAFFRHPARALLQNRLGIRLPDTADETEDSEPQTAQGLARYNLGQRLLAAALAGADEAKLLRLARSGVEYPGGRLGEALLATETKAVIAYANRLRPLWRSRQTEAREISLISGGQSISASLSGLTPDGLLRFRYANAKGSDYIAIWLEHLCLNADGAGLQTRFFARDTDFSFSPLAREDAQARLADWLAAWRDGNQAPLAFYPETAWAWQQRGEGAGRIKWL
ncbi:MAG: exodeoxyribonuclease V subunit gamma, partial [Zoogloeaceae bacterium]|nr:exodeoxyribonuclease V subunit gamma [Zoogloeaceae bacterium]